MNLFKLHKTSGCFIKNERILEIWEMKKSKQIYVQHM